MSITKSEISLLSDFTVLWRQRGPVVKALDVKSVGPGFKSRSGPGCSKAG